MLLCPWSGWMLDKDKRTPKKYDATMISGNTDSRNTMEEYALTRGIVVNGKLMIKRMATMKEIESAVQEALSLKVWTMTMQTSPFPSLGTSGNNIRTLLSKTCRFPLVHIGILNRKFNNRK